LPVLTPLFRCLGSFFFSPAVGARRFFFCPRDLFSPEPFFPSDSLPFFFFLSFKETETVFATQFFSPSSPRQRKGPSSFLFPFSFPPLNNHELFLFFPAEQVLPLFAGQVCRQAFFLFSFFPPLEEDGCAFPFFSQPADRTLTVFLSVKGIVFLFFFFFSREPSESLVLSPFCPAQNPVRL